MGAERARLDAREPRPPTRKAAPVAHPRPVALAVPPPGHRRRGRAGRDRGRPGAGDPGRGLPPGDLPLAAPGGAAALVLARPARGDPAGRGDGVALAPGPPAPLGLGDHRRPRLRRRPGRLRRPPARPAEGGTWITPPMRAAYQRLHDLGHAHSLEVWDADELVGGLYGVGVGGVFTGESMFHLVTDASKVALADLTARLSQAGGCLIDVQMVTPHLASLGARDLPRAEFLDLLARVRDDPVRLPTDRLPVARLG